MTTNIQLNKMNKSFANNLLFSDLSYIFNQRVYHLVGKNGAGKSTLLRLLVGLDSPDSGSIALNNQYSMQKGKPHVKGLFYVPDDLAIYPFLTGEEFLFWITKARTSNLQEIHELIERFELQPHLKTAIVDMSFGTKKKFLLITALIGQPDFIILDEPLNGLDKNSQQVLLMLLKDKMTCCGIILTTHHEAHLDLLNPIKTQILDYRLVDESTIERMVV